MKRALTLVTVVALMVVMAIGAGFSNVAPWRWTKYAARSN